MFIAVILLLLCIPGIGLAADSTAYIMSSGAGISGPGSITSFHPADGTWGPAFFATGGGTVLAVAPGTGQIWEAALDDWSSAMTMTIFDPQSGSVLATIPMPVYTTSIAFDPAGRYAYVSATGRGGNPSGSIVKIEVSSRRIVAKQPFGVWGYSTAGQMAFSADGSKLFVAFAGSEPNQVLAIDPQSLETIASIPISDGVIVGTLLVSGSTLLMTTSESTDGTSQLLYFDTATLQQTKTVALSGSYSYIFGVDPAAGKIFLSNSGSSYAAIEVLDFSTGTMLYGRVIPPVAYYGSLFLSPGASEIVMDSDPMLVFDPDTLAVTQEAEANSAPALPGAAVFLDSSTFLTLNSAVGAMMTVDQATASVTGTFPLGAALLSGEIADGGTEAIYVGTAGYENSFPSVVSAKTNRVVKNLPITAGFTPTAVCGNQVYGFDVRTYVYNLTTKAVTDLPDPVNVPESLYETYVYAGAAPPDGKSYWEPFTIDHRNGGLFLQGDAVYSTETNTVVALLPPMGTIVFSPDSSTAYILATDMIAKYNARSYAPIAQFPYPQITEMVVSASGSLLYAVAGSAVYVLDAKTGVQEQLILLPSAAANIALSPDGSTLFLTSAASNDVYLVSTATGLVTSVSLPNAPNGLVVMPSE